MRKPKRHLLLVGRAEVGWAVFVDGIMVERLRTREQAVSWAEQWRRTATQKEAEVQLVVRD